RPAAPRRFRSGKIRALKHQIPARDLPSTVRRSADQQFGAGRNSGHIAGLSGQPHSAARISQQTPSTTTVDGANSEMPFRTSSSPPHEETADESLRLDLAPTAPSTSTRLGEISMRPGRRRLHLRARQEVDM